MVNKRKLNIRIFGLILTGVVLIVSLIKFSDARKTYFINNNSIQAQLDKIGHKELSLNTTILQSTIFIYSEPLANSNPHKRLISPHPNF